MIIAADYPFLEILGTMVLFFAWVVWIWMMIAILTDVFRRRDIGGWSKALWTFFLIALPFLGAFVYLIAQHDGMAERNIERIEQQEQALNAHIRSVAASDGAAGEIEKAERLLARGTITDAEFDALKAKALAT